MVPAWQAAAGVRLPQRVSPWDPRLLWATLALVAIILVGAAVIVWLDRWRKRSDANPMVANEDLAYFRELYDRGELSAEEFERVRLRLGRQLRKELDVPARAPEDPPAEQAPPPGPPAEQSQPPAPDQQTPPG